MFFAVRDLRVRYKQAALGLLWVAAQPIASVLVFTLVFRYIARSDTGTVPYPLFALAGLVSWTYFSTVVSQGSLVLVDNASLITKVHFPRLVAPVSALVPPLVDLVVGLVLLALLAIAYGAGPTWHLLLAPVWLLLLVATAAGVCLWLSALNVRYRDVKHALGPGLQLWLFASPVVYATEALPRRLEWLHAVNPMAGVINTGRWVLLGTPASTWSVVTGAVVVLLLLVSGVWYFQRSEQAFADIV
nr:ABC transporter permease [Kineococcus siccus]